jgi:hypothetical protein
MVIGSEDGEILFHTRPELIGRDIRQADSRLADLVDAHGQDDPVPGPWTRLPGDSGKRLASAESVSEVPWVVFATVVPREFETEARTAGVINLTVALLAILFAFTVLLYSSGGSRIQSKSSGGARRSDRQSQPCDRVQTLTKSDPREAFNAMTASLREHRTSGESGRELEALNRTLETAFTAAPRTQSLNTA